MRRFFSHWTIVCLSTWLDHITIKLSHKDAIYSCMGIYPPCAMNFKIFQFLILFWFVELYSGMLNKHLPLHLIGYEDNLNLKGRIYIFFCAWGITILTQGISKKLNYLFFFDTLNCSMEHQNNYFCTKYDSIKICRFPETSNGRIF